MGIKPLDPTQVENDVLLWVRSDLGITLHQVSVWADQSGASDPNRNWVASVQRPTLITASPAFNNQPVINLDVAGPNQLMTQAGLWNDAPIDSPFTMIVVGKDDAQIGADKHRPWIGDANVNQWYQATFPNTSISSVTPAFGSSTGVTGVSDVTMNSTTFDTGAPVIFMSEFNDNSSTIRINEDIAEATQDWGTVAAPGKTGITTLGQLALGWAFGTGVSLQGQIAEVIVIFGLLTTAHRRGLLAYLQQRYAISVANLPEGITPLSPADLKTLGVNVGLWTRADMGITASVSMWADQSGADDSRRNLRQPLVTAQPFLIPSAPLGNGRPALQFTLSPFSWLAMAGLWDGSLTSQPYTMIVVASDGASGSQTFLGDLNGNNWYVTATSSKYGASVGLTLVGTTPDSTSLKVLVLEANDPSNSTIRVNGLTPEISGDARFGALPELEVGGAAGGSSSPLAGYFFELIVYKGILSEADLSKVIKSYLGPLYGLSISP